MTNAQKIMNKCRTALGLPRCGFKKGFARLTRESMPGPRIRFGGAARPRTYLKPVPGWSDFKG